MQRNDWVVADMYDADGVLVCRWDDATRTFTDFTVDPPASRPYDATENAELDSRLRADADATAQRSIEDALGNALVTMQSIIDTPNSTINGSPASYIKDIARANRRIIRLLTRRFDGTS